jgi:arsenate reductase
MNTVKKILFICIGNTCRSPMAEGFAREYGKGRVEIRSAGVSAMGIVCADTIDAMKDIGVDISGQSSKQLTRDMISWADIVVTLAGPDAARLVPPGFKGKTFDWRIRDPIGMPRDFMDSVRDDIEKKVRELLSDEVFGSDLTAQQKTGG